VTSAARSWPSVIPGVDGPLVPAYYWAGSGSKFIHWKKGFGRPVDEEAYDRAYDEDRLRWLRDAAGANFVFLTYNWGLPPEIEREDWDAFEQAARRAHALGMGTAAYIQVSNAALAGSYRSAGWYARRPGGANVPFYNGRLFTCLNDEGWRDAVRTRVRDAIERGADAIFLDNCTFGAMPVPLANDYTGFAGCACDRCQNAFRAWQSVRGMEPRGVPTRFRPRRDATSAAFSTWRAATLTGFLRELRETIQDARPGVPMLTNTVGAVNVNTYHLFGVDLAALVEVLDWLFVENLQSPRADRKRVVHNAGTFKLLQAHKPGAPTLSISYTRGIGVDSVPGPTTFARAAAEGYAAGGVPVVRATEYIEGGAWTLLHPARHQAQAAAAGGIARFVAANPDIFAQRRSAAAVVVYVPPQGNAPGSAYAEEHADHLAVIQALICASIPFRVARRPEEAVDDAALLLLPSTATAPAGFQGQAMRFQQLGIPRRRPSRLNLFAGPIEPLLARLGPRMVDGYFTRAFVRRFADRLDLYFRLVFDDQFARRSISGEVLEVLRRAGPCWVETEGSVFADLWETASGLQLHLVNYDDRPTSVRIASRMGAPRRIVAPGREPTSAPAGPEVRVALEQYAVVEWERGLAESAMRRSEP
jgi:hypothetical protein